MPGRAESGSSRPYLLYGVRGWGSAIAECLLVWCEQPYEFVSVEGFDNEGPARDALLALNPLGQVPVLKLPDGTILTESGAIALVLAERNRAAGLAPEPGDRDRVLFLRLLVWLVANVYPTFTYGDYPDRWAGSGGAVLRRTTDEYRAALWRHFEKLAPNGPWVLGERSSALDAYVAVMTHWRPRQAWFADHCPRVAAVAARAARHPALAPVLALNFDRA